MKADLIPAVYGAPPRELAEIPAGAIQVSPLAPGSRALESLDAGSLASAVMLAPPGRLERRYALALALRGLADGGFLTAMAPKDKGGARLRKELEAFGCVVEETSKRHHRICVAARPREIADLEAILAEGGPQIAAPTGLWSQPGVFSWDRDDPGSVLLAQHLPALKGRGADVGCGVGYLSRAVLAQAGVTHLDLTDIDRRAIEAAKLNVVDPRASFHWADIANGEPNLQDLDFVVMNPPFHDAGVQDHGLGQIFIRRAWNMLRKGGSCWIVANRHLPYEATLTQNFTKVQPVVDAVGYKVYEAVR